MKNEEIDRIIEALEGLKDKPSELEKVASSMAHYPWYIKVSRINLEIRDRSKNEVFFCANVNGPSCDNCKFKEHYGCCPVEGESADLNELMRLVVEVKEG